MIFAYGQTDTVGYHYGRKGARSLSLLNYVKNKPVSPTAKYFDVKINKVSRRYRMAFYCVIIISYALSHVKIQTSIAKAYVICSKYFAAFCKEKAITDDIFVAKFLSAMQ